MPNKNKVKDSSYKSLDISRELPKKGVLLYESTMGAFSGSMHKLDRRQSDDDVLRKIALKSTYILAHSRGRIAGRQTKNHYILYKLSPKRECAYTTHMRFLERDDDEWRYRAKGI